MKLGLLNALLFFSMFSAHAQQFKWVRGGGSVASIGTSSSDWEQVKFMCTDPNGNVYVLSNVGDDPITADTFNATPYGAPYNVLITSYNCSGQMRWAKLIASSGNSCTPYGITADSLGNIYVAGLYYEGGGTTYIGHDTVISGPATEYLLMGLIQFDTSGHFNWIRYVGNNTLATTEGTGALYNPITIDGANNAHYFCYLRSGVTLMTGVISVNGEYDLTYNPGGTLLSAVHLDLGSEWIVRGTVIDPVTNKLYTWGEINQSSGATDTFFAAAFNTSRNLLWQYFAGHGDDDGITGIALDKSKHLYFSGAAQPFSGETRFVFNNDSVSAPGFFDISIIMKTDTNGNVGWIKHYDGYSNNAFEGITLLPENKVAATGYFYEEVIRGADTINAGVGTDPFFTVVDTSGDLYTLRRIHGDSYYDAGNAITADKIGNLYIGGYVGDTIPDTLIPSYHSVGGNTDFFVVKYGVDCSCTSMPAAAYTSTGTTTVNFTYTGTTTDIDSMRWNFGDGGTSSLTNPTYTYTASGTYQACVTVYTDCGNDSVCNEYVVPCLSVPTASYTHTGMSPIINYTYTGISTGVDSVVWHFGDGSVSSGFTASHTYSAIATYTVCATAYTACDSNTYCDTVVISSLSVPTISVSNVQVFPNPVNDRLYIIGVPANASYRLLNVTGECMQQGTFVYGSNTLAVKNFASGVYILEMTGADRARNMIKVVKQ